MNELSSPILERKFGHLIGASEVGWMIGKDYKVESAILKSFNSELSDSEP